MKITAVEPLVVDVGSRNWLFVVVETDEGVSGVGEGSLPGHPRAVAAAVEEYREYVVGEDPARIQHLWQLMYRRPFFRGGVVTLSAMSAIEQDRKSTRLNSSHEWISYAVFCLKKKTKMYTHSLL